MSAALASVLRSGAPETEQLVDDFRDLAEPVVRQAEGKDFLAQWQAMADLGVLRLAPPGATAPGPVTRSLAMIEGLGLAGADPGLCYALTSQIFGMQFPLRDAVGADAWQRVADVQEGGALLCHALTERGGGSDPFSMRTRARREGEGFVLDGAKTFITAAPVADRAIVFARTAEERSPFALSAFLVPLDLPGVRRGETFTKTALPTVPMGELLFDEVRLPGSALLGRQGSGLAVMASTTAWERAVILGYALGPMRRLLARTVEWAAERNHFGRRMGASHQVAARVSDMALALHRSRVQLYAMAARLDAGTPTRLLAAEAALTKISVSEDYVRLTGHATALAGVRAFLPGFDLAADLASPAAALTYAGPNDLLRVNVARQLGLPVEN
ncbi:acyl-CoA dehydrogenase [Streptomyces spiroverticillatus]|uniref:Acyl-CoA dehydrogenase n=1 Tax=Streptomyces finlayi TaxID=67296 RepID=A0A918WTF1_9ACTN|nr:acyl-CoA dehydrogenase [Streptomyces finlayi]GGZ89922.1 acyl-CoA dehydrogenase [Streptomyces spiroverticillatus]GHC80712.1 acyl-CoA dehydrogenase [Streptomyces finlayi]